MAFSIPSLSAVRQLALGLCLAALGSAAVAQDEPASGPIEGDVVGGISNPTAIAIPDMPTPRAVGTPAGNTEDLGRQVARVIEDDLRNSGFFNPVARQFLRDVDMPQVTAPDYPAWSQVGAQNLVQGYVQAGNNGRLTVGCYLYDVFAQAPLERAGYEVDYADWRRAAHRCADMVYARLTGEGAYFDSRIVYVAESGPKDNRVRRIAVMDTDGANHRFLTNGQSIVLTPRYAPDGRTITYMSYLNDEPRVYIYDLETGRQRLLVDAPYMTFAPRYSPDSRYVVFSMAVNGNSDIYRVPVSGGRPVRLTNTPGIDTSASYSPDGRRIVFESDRSGGQQLYVMNADGSNQRRISFGGGRYATPEWSPRGNLVAFTRLGGGFRIGVMRSDGSGERILTNSWQDEGPSWAPNGRVIHFFRTPRGNTLPSLWSVDVTGRMVRRLPTPVGASDPSWSPLRN
ncbi:Tol-Pal system protein TolB [Parasphingopyxis algicola]|uniref:Tol-Pal system beta propeller repeat protein TolB n=1 Tax=Parasphingopyxis algicola TaxID=2026624 RepID=UPI00159FBCAF|nr:Tol-Pal system beta propeller repeat protein TolB [Parasphingopyxis algicola]QLC25464.1 Tol-Pal system protein TolB [Parasphingopyxis algicola]